MRIGRIAGLSAHGKRIDLVFAKHPGSHGVWARFPAELGGMGTDNESWCIFSFYDVKPGVYVPRARFAGTDYNGGSLSKMMRIVVP